MEHWPQAPWVVTGGSALLLAVAWFQLRTLAIERRTAVAIFDEGFAWQVGRGDVESARWSEIAEITYHVVRHELGALCVRRTHRHRVSTVHGQTVVLTNGVAQIDLLMTTLTLRARPHLAVRDSERLRAGEQVAFGPISIDLRGLTLGKHLVPWQSVWAMGLTVDDRYVVIHGGSVRSLVLKVRAERVPNRDVLSLLSGALRYTGPEDLPTPEMLGEMEAAAVAEVAVAAARGRPPVPRRNVVAGVVCVVVIGGALFLGLLGVPEPPRRLMGMWVLEGRYITMRASWVPSSASSGDGTLVVESGPWEGESVEADLPADTEQAVRAGARLVIGGTYHAHRGEVASDALPAGCMARWSEQARVRGGVEQRRWTESTETLEDLSVSLEDGPALPAAGERPLVRLRHPRVTLMPDCVWAEAPADAVRNGPRR